jgi:hypothetical protein
MNFSCEFLLELSRQICLGSALGGAHLVIGRWCGSPLQLQVLERLYEGGGNTSVMEVTAGFANIDRGVALRSDRGTTGNALQQN